MQAGEQNNKNYGKIVGSTIASAALPASLALGGGTGATALGRAGNAALKAAGASAALGGGEALSQGQTVGESAGAAAKAGALGGALGGAAQGAGELASFLTKNFPARLVRQALPKIEKGNEAYVLKNTKVGPIKSLLEESDATVSGLGEQVQNVLTHSRYADDFGAGDFAIKKTLNAFPNSEYDAATVVSTVKRLVPAQARLVDKVANGTATLVEKNRLRSAIDPVIKKVFTDAPEVSSSKALAAEFANAARRGAVLRARDAGNLLASEQGDKFAQCSPGREQEAGQQERAGPVRHRSRPGRVRDSGAGRHGHRHRRGEGASQPGRRPCGSEGAIESSPGRRRGSERLQGAYPRSVSAPSVEVTEIEADCRDCYTYDQGFKHRLALYHILIF